MTRYEKPILNIVELQVKESVASSLVPKNMFRSQPATSSSSSSNIVNNNIDNEIASLESFGTSNETT